MLRKHDQEAPRRASSPTLATLEDRRLMTRGVVPAVEPVTLSASAPVAAVAAADVMIAAGEPGVVSATTLPAFDPASTKDWIYSGSDAQFGPASGYILYGGNAWPTNYAPQNYQVSPYYSRYFGYNDGLDYRYADGAILGVNPQTQTIDGIAALLTGNQWNVGSPMPAGYDLYNVPPAYRNQYLDSPTSMYRYSDGYVYQVDPKTQLVQQAIQLLGNVL